MNNYKDQSKLDSIESIPSTQWRVVNNNDNFSIQIYTHAATDFTVYKLIKDLTTNTDLDHFKACFTTLEIRKQWYPEINDIQYINSNTVRINDITCVEQTIKKKSLVKFMTSYSIDEQPHFLACIIENKLNYARATLYYQWERLTPVTYTTATLSTLLNNLIHLEPFPYIDRHNQSISIQNTCYQHSTLEFDYVYHDDQPLLPAPAVDIHQKMNRTQRWHSGSWDQQQDRSNQYNQTLRKNKFMSSSFLFASASANSSPQLKVWTSEEDMDHYIQPKDELRIHSPYIPQLNISLPGKDHHLVEKFAQLCVSLYHDDCKKFYIIQILHPQKFMHYFTQDSDFYDNEETMKLDDEDETKPIHVRLLVAPSPDNQFRVNDNKWPIRSWSKSNHSDEEEEEEEQQQEEIQEDEDIFVDGMEDTTEQVKMPGELQPDVPKELLSSPPLPPLSPPEHPLLKNHPLAESSSSSQNYDTNASQKEQPEIDQEIKIPEHDPVALQKAHPKFIEYLLSIFQHASTVIQSPNKDNGYVSVKKIDIPEHPLGGFLGESTWRDCSIWDIKAVIENAGARKVWDNTFESSTFLHGLTNTSSIWHTKMKGAWPVSPRDYVYFHGQYTTPTRIDLLSTSCFGDSFQYKALPSKEVPGYVRATADVMGWRLERLDEKTTSVKQVIVTQFPTWVVSFITSRFITQTCAAVQAAQTFFINFGAPPCLEDLSRAQLVNVKYDHERKNWRCEYIRRVDSEQKDASTTCVIRLDKRRWAAHNRYGVVIDPPPSRVSALQKVCDPYGVWLTVEHDEAFIIPLRGKILVLIKPDESSTSDTECRLNVNGVATTIEKEKQTQRLKQASFSENFLREEQVIKPPLTEEERINSALDQLTISPKEHAQAALSFLKQTDEQFGWTVISDNTKQGLRISKKSGIKTSSKKIATETDSKYDLKIYDPYMIYKGSKVIENFSVDEVTAVITNTNHVRKIYDDTIEHPIDIIREQPGLKIIRQYVKAIFPFKNREYYTVSCLAQEETAAQTSLTTKRVFFVESSIPEFPIINKNKTRGNMFVSGWILEPIDPYNTTTANHPIPSTRVTYVASLDLGNAVPSYISNLVANNWFPKKIQSVEQYLKSKGPPPYLSDPNSNLMFTNGQLLPLSDHNEYEWTRVNSSYDVKHQFKVMNHLKIMGKESADIKRKVTQQQQQQQQQLPPSSPPSQPIALDEMVVPSPSTSTTMPPFRRPSTHTISSGAENRRGSLPTNAISKKRNINVVTPSMTNEKTTMNQRPLIFLQATFDLRVYPKGYEIQAQLYNVTEKRKNVSDYLVLSISEPPSSHLIDKNIKHKVTITAQGLPSSFGLYEFEFSLVPASDDILTKKATQLTVSHVLGEVKEGWNGIMTVNGIEAQVNQDIQLKSLDDDEEEESSHETTLVDVTDSSIGLMMGSGVVATALGNVSAGVNNIGARMMIPFRAASNSFLVREETNQKTQEFEQEVETTSSDDEQEQFTKENGIDTTTTVHEVRLLRRSSDTMRKGMFLLLICIGLAIIFALLMLQPLLERFYSSFIVSSTIESLEQSIEKGIVTRLMQIPWFGGWDIQIIAVKREIV